MGSLLVGALWFSNPATPASFGMGLLSADEAEPVLRNVESSQLEEADRGFLSPPVLQVLIPLYIYPAPLDVWKEVAAANQRVPVTAIINPHNGPGGPPNADYIRGLALLRQANVTLLGYVYTNYGERDLASIQADIALYDQYFALDGIFFDQVANDSDKLAFYQHLYAAVKACPRFTKVFLNPGAPIEQDYLERTAGDTVVIFEETSATWRDYLPDPYLEASSPEHFAMFIYDVPDVATMQAHIDLAVQRRISYLYLTDDGLPNPWDRLPTHWNAQIEYIRAVNCRASAGVK